ncbi:MAG: hypothetical protein RLZZ252_1718, partial [Bacteroidota bacterium]
HEGSEHKRMNHGDLVTEISEQMRLFLHETTGCWILLGWIPRGNQKDVQGFIAHEDQC